MMGPSFVLHCPLVENTRTSLFAEKERTKPYKSTVYCERNDFCVLEFTKLRSLQMFIQFTHLHKGITGSKDGVELLTLSKSWYFMIRWTGLMSKSGIPRRWPIFCVIPVTKETTNQNLSRLGLTVNISMNVNLTYIGNLWKHCLSLERHSWEILRVFMICCPWLWTYAIK